MAEDVWCVQRSKHVRTVPRDIRYMVALNALQSQPLIRSIYVKAPEKGMEKMAALGLYMHKILRIIYGMLKHNNPFSPEIDLKNRATSTQGKSKSRKEKNRRYQTLDANAPISRRQTQKRKERKQSQSDNNAKKGIIKKSTVPSFST